MKSTNFLIILLVILNSSITAIADERKLDDIPIKEEAYFLTLEKDADAKLEKSLHPVCGKDLKGYERELFFRDLVDIYEKAASCAIELNMNKDAIRLIEKQAKIWEEHLSNERVAIYKLLDACKICKKIQDEKTFIKIREKLHDLIDKDLNTYLKRRDNPAFANFRWHCNFEIARSMLMKAEIFEITDPLLAENAYKQVEEFCNANDVSYDYVKETQHEKQKEDNEDDDDERCSIDDLNNLYDLIRIASQLETQGQKELAIASYEEAGKKCMEYYKENTAIGHLHPALIAGLCFEKNPNTTEHAKNAFEALLDEYNDTIRDSEGSVNTNDDGIDKVFKFIFAAPYYREVSLACLRCGKQEMFVNIICRQSDDVISIFNNVENIDEIEEEFWYLIDYIEASINVTEIIFEKDRTNFAQYREKLSNLNEKREQKKPSLTQLEAELLNIYAAPRSTTVDEMINRLESDNLIQP